MKFDWNRESEIIDAIKSGGKTRDLAIVFLYNDAGTFNKLKYFVRQNNGNLQDAEDVFQEGLIIFDRNIRQDKYKGTDSLGAYFYAICKLTWKNKLRKKRRTQLVDDIEKFDEELAENPESIFFA